MWQDVLLRMLLEILKKATPEIRNRLKEFLDRWENDAKATANPFDDILVMLVRGILGI